MKKFIRIFLVILSLLLSACVHKASVDSQSIAVDTVVATPLSPEKINQKEYIQLTSDYKSYSERIESLGLKSRGVNAFSESYFLEQNVLIIGFPTSPDYKYSLNKILQSGNTATIYVDRIGPKDVTQTKVAVCLIIGINKEQSKSIKEYTVITRSVVK